MSLLPAWAQGLVVGLAFGLGYVLGFKRAVHEVRDFILHGRRR